MPINESNTWVSKTLPILKNKFFLVGIAYLLYLIFIDSNDLLSQWKLKKELSSLEDQSAFYTEQIKQVKQERDELFSGIDQLEKFGREKYHMKRDSEDLFLIVEEEKERKVFK
ncbi:MAG: septum formation initiator family protein [Chitinophagales bacterium]|nr:septum formation initiator family protein [Chitinophagales bacterium]